MLIVLCRAGDLDYDRELTCPGCTSDLVPPGDLTWWDIDVCKCPKCGALLQREYDENYDSETGEESGYFWLTAATD